jgi:uncharacterized damage-inducible protein DinB
MLANSRARTLAAVDGLTVEQLNHQHDDQSNPIGALLAHTAAVEWLYCVSSLDDRAPDGQEWAEWGHLVRLTPATWQAARGLTLEQHRDRLRRVRERTLAGIATKSDAWLLEPLKLMWLPEPSNHLWAWYHVIEDELNHRGQIRWLRQRL